MRPGAHLPPLLAIVALASAIVLGAQDPSPVFRGGVDIVHVDVSVLDKDRKPVRGLTAADFTVLEDGKPRPIVAFAPVDVPGPAPTVASAPGAPWLQRVPADVATNQLPTEGRLLVIVFDWSIRFADQALARRVARGAVQEMGPVDVGAVVYTGGFSAAGTRQPFTLDRARLFEAIDRPMTPAMVDANGELLDLVPETNGVIDTPSCVCGVCVFEKVGDVADAVSTIPGRRKTLLFISNYSPPPAGVLPKVGTPIPFCQVELQQARDEMTRKLNAASVTVHVIEPAGVEAMQMFLGAASVLGETPPPANTSFARQADLPFLANLTNGRTVMNTNVPESYVPAIMAETSSYYLLAFPSGDPTFTGRAHRIEVQVARRDVTVQARSRYVAGETAAAREAALRKAPLAEAIEATLPRPDRPLGLMSMPFATPGRETVAVGVVLRAEPVSEAPAAGITAERRDRVEIVVTAVDLDGHVVGGAKHALTIPWRPGETTTGPYEVVSRLNLKPGRYEIRAAVDAPATRSSVYGIVDVPKFEELPVSLSGVALEALPVGRSVPAEALADFIPIVPTARRTFASTDLVTAFVRAYRRRPEDPAPVVTAEVVDARGAVVFDDTLDADGTGYRVDLPIERLSPGDYLLQIIAVAGEDTARRDVRFTVR